jgi:biotin operon repressor
MTDPESEKDGRRQAMRQLREERKEKIASAAARMKEQKRAIKAIKETLKDGDLSVPQISEKTGMATSQILWTITALRKYGEVAEGEKAGSYFRYKLAEGAEADAGLAPEEDER